MGRAKQTRTTQTQDTRRNGVDPALEELRKRLYKFDVVVKPLSGRFLASATGRDTQEERNAAMAREVRALPPALQRKLIEAAQVSKGIANEHPDSKLGNEAKRIGNDAREVFIFAHTGYVMQQVRRQVGVFESENAETATQLLRQEAYLGLNDAVDAFQLNYIAPDNDDLMTPEELTAARKAFEESKLTPAEYAAKRAAERVASKLKNGEDTTALRLRENKDNPLTYATGKIRHRVSEARETGPLITAKSRAFDSRQKVEAYIKAQKSHGGAVDIDAIAEKLDLTPARVQQLIGTLTTKARIDAPISSGGEGEGDTTMASIIPDHATNIESSVVDDTQRDVIRKEAATLKPFQRRVIELHFNLVGGEKVEQKDLYDGVFVDPETGDKFSSEGTVISDRSKRGIDVAKTSQKELNQRFARGELVFEAGTPESFSLALLKKQGGSDDKDLPKPSREEMLSRTVTRETGTPMTSGQIQDAKDQALYTLSQREALKPMKKDLRSRGNHELENSLQARKFVRAALEAVGEIEEGAGERVKAGRASRDGSHKRGILGQLAEKRGWINENGAVQYEKLRADVAAHRADAAKAKKEDSVDYADLMSS